MIRRISFIAALLILLGTISFQQAPKVQAFEEVTVYVTESSNTVIFTVHDPRALDHLTTAVLVTTEQFETEVLVDWEPDATSPAYKWTVSTDSELAEIYFLADIPLLWSISGQWHINENASGILRGKFLARLPLVFSN